MRPLAQRQGCKVGQASPGGLPWQQGKFCSEATAHRVGWEGCLPGVRRQAIKMAFGPQRLIRKMGAELLAHDEGQR